MEYVVFDIETTGLLTMNDRIVEIGAVKVRDGFIIETFSQLLNPDIFIPAEVTNINHITNDMIRYALPSNVVLLSFAKFIASCDFLVGHNAVKFDYPFLTSEFQRSGIYYEQKRVRDTVFLARKYLPMLKKYSLAALCEYFNIENTDAHRALSDCLATQQLFEHLIRVKETQSM